MQLKKILPSLSLQPFVKNFWILEVNEQDIPFSKLLFPYGAFELIINLSGAPSMKTYGDRDERVQPVALFAGQFTRPFTLNYTAGFHSVGASFHPWAGNLLFNIPAEYFTDCLTGFDELDKKSKLVDQLMNAKTETALIGYLEAYLWQRAKTYQLDPIVPGIAHAILADASVESYKKVIETAGCSRRRIEQQFLAATGLPMGVFTRKVRFQKAVNSLRSSPQTLLTHLGLSAGYYDQPHFIREFKSFSGMTPKDFLRREAEESESDISERMMAPWMFS